MAVPKHICIKKSENIFERVYAEICCDLKGVFYVHSVCKLRLLFIGK